MEANTIIGFYHAVAQLTSMHNRNQRRLRPLHCFGEGNPGWEDLELDDYETGEDPAAELLEVCVAMREWIDAVPSDTVLPAMPGFDRDWADTAIDQSKQMLNKG